jgi:hypothetical protein
MNLNESSLRAIIRSIINENAGNLEEMQKGKQFDLYLDMELSKLTPDVPEGALGHVDVMREVRNQLKAKLDRIFLKNFDYNNFYVVKLGGFIIKTNEGDHQVSFFKEGVEDKKYSYPYLYVYNDKAEAIKFGSRFFESDPLILGAANEFIKNKGYKLNARTMEPGTVQIITDFDQNNIIDLVDYSKIKRPEAPKKDISPNAKNAYIAGQPFTHKLYGKGKIVKTKKFGLNDAGAMLYNVTVDFGGKEKTFRIPTKVQEPDMSMAAE